MKSRYKFLIGGGIIFAVIAALSIQGLQEMTVFFYTPQEIIASPGEFEDRTIRIGALVQQNTVQWDAQNIRLSFNVTEDSQSFVPVVYNGVRPDMFREGQGVVVEGQMKNGIFHADKLLVKHSEEYSVDTADHKKDKKDYYKSLMDQ